MNKPFWGVVALLVVVYVGTLWAGGWFQKSAAAPEGRTLDGAMFVAQSKLERHFELADRFSYRNLKLVKAGGDDVICGEVIPIGTPALGIPWSRFVLYVDGNHGYFGGEYGGFEFWKRYEKDPISPDRFNSVWNAICS